MLENTGIIHIPKKDLTENFSDGSQASLENLEYRLRSFSKLQKLATELESRGVDSNEYWYDLHRIALRYIQFVITESSQLNGKKAFPEVGSNVVFKGADILRYYQFESQANFQILVKKAMEIVSRLLDISMSNDQLENVATVISGRDQKLTQSDSQKKITELRKKLFDLHPDTNSNYTSQTWSQRDSILRRINQLRGNEPKQFESVTIDQILLKLRSETFVRMNGEIQFLPPIKLNSGTSQVNIANESPVFKTIFPILQKTLKDVQKILNYDKNQLHTQMLDLYEGDFIQKALNCQINDRADLNQIKIANKQALSIAKMGLNPALGTLLNYIHPLSGDPQREDTIEYTRDYRGKINIPAFELQLLLESDKNYLYQIVRDIIIVD